MSLMENKEHENSVRLSSVCLKDQSVILIGCASTLLTMWVICKLHMPD